MCFRYDSIVTLKALFNGISALKCRIAHLLFLFCGFLFFGHGFNIIGPGEYTQLDWFLNEFKIRSLRAFNVIESISKCAAKNTKQMNSSWSAPDQLVCGGNMWSQWKHLIPLIVFIWARFVWVCACDHHSRLTHRLRWWCFWYGFSVVVVVVCWC